MSRSESVVRQTAEVGSVVEWRHARPGVRGRAGAREQATTALPTKVAQFTPHTCQLRLANPHAVKSRAEL